MEETLRLGTRGSLLARLQSQKVADALEKQHSGLRVELQIIKTTGDQVQDRPLNEVGGKGLFTKELEQALLDGRIDFAVHSFKDVPVTQPLVDVSALLIAAVPKREDARDVLVSPQKRPEDLPHGARVGTGSMRRMCQLLDMRPDLVIEGLRGNIDTRLRKRRDGEFDAVVLAAAGLKRTGLFDGSIMTPIDPQQMLPAPAQGALALQCRADDRVTRERLALLNDAQSSTCVEAEREVVRLLEGDCHSPIAALARLEGDRLYLQVAVGARDGRPPVLRAEAQGPADDVKAVADEACRKLVAQGVQQLLRPGNDVTA
jgi:hydroxymethylbilane synthase